MRVEFEFHATFRDAVGERTGSVDVEAGTTVNAAVRAVAAKYDDLEPLVVRSDGTVRPNVAVAVEGDPMTGESNAATLSEGDTVILAPGVAGGVTGPEARSRVAAVASGGGEQ